MATLSGAFEKAIEKAVDRNIIVYDADSDSGRLSVRLLALIRARHKDYNKDAKLTNIYIHESHFADLKEALIINPRILNLYCVKFINMNLTEIFLSDKTVSLVTGKQYVVLAEFEDKNGSIEFLLGNF